MEYQTNRGEATIDLRQLAAVCIKRWRSILLAMLIGAVVLGGIEVVSAPALLEPTSAVVEEVRTAISANIAKAAELSSTLDAEIGKIEENEMLIESRLAEIELLREKNAELQSSQEDYQAIFEELEALRGTTEGAAKISILQQITTLTGKLQDLEIQIETNKKAEKGYRDEIRQLNEANEEIRRENADRVAQAAGLAKMNGRLLASLAPKPGGVSRSAIVKKAVVGLILGAFLVVCWVGVKFIFTGKLHSVADLKERYGAFVLGSLYVAPGKRTWLDRAACRLAGEAVHLDEAEEYRLIAAKTRLKCQEPIYITGTIPREQLERVCSGLVNNGLPLTALDNPVYRADATAALKDAKVIVVEAKDKSDTREIDKLMEQLYVSKAELIGVIEV